MNKILTFIFPQIILLKLLRVIKQTLSLLSEDAQVRMIKQLFWIKIVLVISLLLIPFVFVCLYSREYLALLFWAVGYGMVIVIAHLHPLLKSSREIAEFLRQMENHENN